jgi:hypothetical protein
VPSAAWSEQPVTSVRRLLPSFVEGLQSPRRKREIEREHGNIDATEWNRLREMLALKDRLNAGDWSPLISTDGKEALEPLAALLDRMSPGGWFIEDHNASAGKTTYRSASGDGRSVEIDIGKVTLTPIERAKTRHKDSSRFHLVAERGGKIARGQIRISGEVKGAAFALSETFTVGLSRTRFVVWWHDAAKKLVPGLLPRHRDSLVCAGDVEQRDCRGMGNLPEVRRRLSTQPCEATLLLPQMPSGGGDEASPNQPETEG